MLALLLIPLYALADRFAGGGWPALDARLPGRALFWGALACALAGYAIGGVVLAAFGGVWFLYRFPPWKLFLGGGINPVGPVQIAGTFLRHLLVAPMLAVVAYWFHRDPIQAAAAGAGYAVIAASLGAWFGLQTQNAARSGKPLDHDVNAPVELGKGAAFGAAVAALSLVWGL